MIPLEEWDFRTLATGHEAEAFVYEYCRSEEWIRQALKSPPSLSYDSEYGLFSSDRDVHIRELRIDVNQARAQWHRPWRTRLKGEKSDEVAANASPVWQRVTRIFARRDPLPGRYNPFVHHDRVLTLGTGFPDLPYLRNNGAFAPAEIRHGLAVHGVHDLGGSFLAKKFPKNHAIWQEAQGRFRDKRVWTFSAPNGERIELARNDAEWRRFTLALDFSLPNEEIEAAFRDFLEEARVKYDLPVADKEARLSRRGIPTFMSPRFCFDSLRSLGAHRLMMAYEGDRVRAYHYLGKVSDEIAKKTLFAGPKELARSAARYPLARQKLFGTGLE